MTKANFIARSALFVPGNNIERIEKAMSSEADAVIVDLEDAVVPAEKAQARQNVCRSLLKSRDKYVVVRVNSLSSEYFESDISGVAVSGLDAIMLPKVNNDSDIIQIHDKLTRAEQKAGLAAGSIKVIPLFESAFAIENLLPILVVKTTPSRLLTASFGAVDYAFDMGIELTLSGEELLYPRSKICIACRAAGLDAPIDSPYILDLKNTDGIRTDALRAKQLGFGGKLCVHPVQVPICNEVFSPSKKEIEFANMVLTAYDRAQAKGDGVFQIEGRMIDRPVVEMAKRVLRIAGSLV